MHFYYFAKNKNLLFAMKSKVKDAKLRMAVIISPPQNKYSNPLFFSIIDTNNGVTLKNDHNQCFSLVRKN